jgi:hypothetical protein
MRELHGAFARMKQQGSEPLRRNRPRGRGVHRPAQYDVHRRAARGEPPSARGRPAAGENGPLGSETLNCLPPPPAVANATPPHARLKDGSVQERAFDVGGPLAEWAPLRSVLLLKPFSLPSNVSPKHAPSAEPLPKPHEQRVRADGEPISHLRHGHRHTSRPVGVDLPCQG